MAADAVVQKNVASSAISEIERQTMLESLLDVHDGSVANSCRTGDLRAKASEVVTRDRIKPGESYPFRLVEVSHCIAIRESYESQRSDERCGVRCDRR